MSFISLVYALFLPIIIVIYWSVGAASSSLRMGLLLAFSLIFYASLQLQYIPLLLVVSFINFQIAKAITSTIKRNHLKAKASGLSPQDWQALNGVWNHQATQLLGLGIGLNVVVLVAFKYIPFILNSIAALLNFPLATESANWISERLIAPLGISFFAFECIAYLIDVYRGAPATENFLSFASYKFFFPKLISGPITRYNYFATQSIKQHFPNFDQCIEGVWLIACGAVKKALIADRVGIFVDLCFGNLERASSVDLWLGIVAYGLQLYLDFSGYVDMARGSAKLLGFNLPENFDFPYYTTSIAEFWRKWHISLGDWLRNYLYFPLGGSRQGLGRTCTNLMIVMLIAGIWHGAAWGYVLWGGLHGLALVIHRLVDSLSDRASWLKNAWQTIPGILCAWMITQMMVFSSWLFFRVPNPQKAWLAVQHLWQYSGDVQFVQKVYVEALGIERSYITLMLVIIIAGMTLAYVGQRIIKLHLNWVVKLVLVPISLYLVWLFAPEGALPYIYFDF